MFKFDENDILKMVREAIEKKSKPVTPQVSPLQRLLSAAQRKQPTQQVPNVNQ
ncbi:MAG: hypothetical protein WC455_20845 [Dehalococcoidia bacterium]|jgi:hypothetical protein